MKKENKKPSIQERIKLRLSNYGKENKLFLFVVFSVVVVYFVVWFNFPSAREAFIAEFYAGFSGILIAFYLDRMIEKQKGRKISKQILESISIELNLGLGLVYKIMEEIKGFDFSKMGGLEFFHLFQTNAWKTFSSKLELDDIETLYELGTIYHRFELFNEAMKLEPDCLTLSDFLSKNPKFLEELQQVLDTAIDRLAKLKGYF